MALITETFLAKPKFVEPTKPFLLTHIPKHFTAHEVHQAKVRGITPEEYVRRNNIVQGLSAQVRLRPGDTAYPESKAGYQKYGACLVIGVCHSYKDFSFDDKWPDNDCPYVVTFTPLGNREIHMHCTHHYLVAKNPHILTC
jgi:hypothetical protein